jgi:putative redox protein
MALMSVEYIGDLHCQATHESSDAQIGTDAPKDNQGKGEDFSPTDLVGVALATCIATVLGIYAQRVGWDLKGMRLNVQKEMRISPFRAIASLALEIWVPIVLSEEEKAKFELIAHTCPVHKSLHPDIAVPMIFHWK